MQIKLLFLTTLITSAFADKLLHCECRNGQIADLESTEAACRSPGRMEHGVCVIWHSKMMRFKCARGKVYHCADAY
ncbi:hypothetical protein LX32DRAFT_289658 [Colletotrichum zoysiae]|uniref:Uncharacterized protein n=1 Tax=Colletotrichum zoysiae TaxID=1216348 RepID=A0AAD9H268_9PEZI|nr:hypothetical protein LX32DRAFT_289658 [Colletotrichum zoysiae]